MSVRVAVVTEIEPRPSPAFPVMRRREKPVDNSFKGIRTFIGEKLVNFVQRRRQPNQIECGSSDMSFARCHWRRLEIIFM
jgi:hypothetical protein